MATETTVLITGATDGIGLQTALECARRGARVLLHGRSEKKLEAARTRVESKHPGRVAGLFCHDLSSLANVRAMGDAVRRQHDALDVLLANAGVFKKTRELTADGHEVTFAVNHLAHVLLVHELLPLLRRAPSSRIVVVSSVAHGRGTIDWDDLGFERGFDGYSAYARSKLANILFTVELARRLGRSPSVNALHPGVVSTNLLREGFGMGGPDSVVEGAETSVHLCLSEDVEGRTGGYYIKKERATPHALAADAQTTSRFYELSCRMVGVEPLRASAS